MSSNPDSLEPDMGLSYYDIYETMNARRLKDHLQPLILGKASANEPTVSLFPELCYHCLTQCNKKKNMKLSHALNNFLDNRPIEKLKESERLIDLLSDKGLEGYSISRNPLIVEGRRLDYTILKVNGNNNGLTLRNKSLIYEMEVVKDWAVN
jgi:hypothetical protein